MNLKYKSWKDITISTYQQLMEISAVEKDIDPIDLEIGYLAILCDCDEEEVLNLPITTYQSIRQQAQFIANRPEIKAKKPNKLRINWHKYKFITDISKLTTAQYIDFQNWQKDNGVIKNLEYVLSCFIIPKGKKYGEYDIDEVIADIRQMNVIDALQYAFFLLMQYICLTRTILNYSISQIERNKNKTPQMMEGLNKMKELRNLLTNGLG